jgi:hypothetical protein
MCRGIAEFIMAEQRSPTKSERNGASEAPQATVVPKGNTPEM